jgi:hypothetical protein
MFKASVMVEGSDNEPRESAIKKELLSSVRHGIDAVINYACPSTNRKLQAYYKHL